MRKSKTGISPKAAAEILKKRGYDVDPRALGEFRDNLLKIATPIKDIKMLAELAELSLEEFRSIRKKAVNFQRLKEFYFEDIAKSRTGHDVARHTPDAFDDFLTRYTVTEQHGIVARFRSIYYNN